MTSYDKPLPEPDEDTAAFWEACRHGDFILQRCRECGGIQSYPRKTCTNCFSGDLAFEKASGAGTIYSFTVVHRPPPGFEEDAPYVLAIIALEEGPHFMSNVTHCDPYSVAIGMPVEVYFDEVAPEISLPKFTLAVR